MESLLKEAEDSFGNIFHHMSAEGPISSIKILVEGDIITFDTNAIISGAIERMPNIFYIRDTPLSLVNPEIAYFTHNAIKNDLADLNKCHCLLNSRHECMSFDNNATNINTTAAEEFFTKKAYAKILQIYSLLVRSFLNIPARYVKGYYLRNDTDRQTAGHEWAEAYISD